MFIYNNEHDAIFFACHGSFASMAREPAVMDAVRLCLPEQAILGKGATPQAEATSDHFDIGFSFSMAFRCATGALSLIDAPSQSPAVDQLLVRALAV